MTIGMSVSRIQGGENVLVGAGGRKTSSKDSRCGSCAYYSAASAEGYFALGGYDAYCEGVHLG
jgi:hypothetical protein